MSRSLRSDDFCRQLLYNNDDKTDRFTPCTCTWGNYPMHVHNLVQITDEFRGVGEVDRMWFSPHTIIGNHYVVYPTTPLPYPSAVSPLSCVARAVSNKQVIVKLREQNNGHVLLSGIYLLLKLLLISFLLHV